MASGGYRPGAGRKALDSDAYLQRIFVGAALQAAINRAHEKSILERVSKLPVVKRLAGMRAAVESEHGRSVRAGELVEARAAKIHADKRLRAGPLTVRRSYDKRVAIEFAARQNITVRHARECLDVYRRFQKRSAREDCDPSSDLDSWPPVILAVLRELAAGREASVDGIPAEVWNDTVETVRAMLSDNGETAAVMLMRLEQQAREREGLF